MAKKVAKKVFYYKDLLHDDFAGTKIEQVPIDENYPYVRRGLFYRIGAFFLTYFFAIPILMLVLKIGYGFRVKNRKVLRKVRGKPLFLYGNHTQAADSFVPQAGVTLWRKVYILSNPDATSIKGIKTIVAMLGGLPLPDTKSNFRASANFMKALDYYVSRRKVIAIYPEAHIWPYYTGIRPFLANSFVYPVNYDAPSIAMVTTYRKRRFRKKPSMTVTLSEPFYPDRTLGKKEAREKLRDQVYQFMMRHSENSHNYAYYDYIALND